jgi:predicted nucleic acid-binding protein
MTTFICVIDSSQLIVFQRIEQFDLLCALLRPVYIPPAVRREVFGAADPLPEWIEERQLIQPLASQIVASRLGPGESEAIALALELRATELVLDDLAARRLAQSLHIAVIGSAGLLLRAKTKGLIPEVRPLMEAMQRAEFHISARVYAGILAAAGEV